MNFIRNRKFRAGPQTSLEGFICPQNSDKQQKIKVFGRSGGQVLLLNIVIYSLLLLVFWKYGNCDTAFMKAAHYIYTVAMGVYGSIIMIQFTKYFGTFKCITNLRLYKTFSRYSYEFYLFSDPFNYVLVYLTYLGLGDFVTSNADAFLAFFIRLFGTIILAMLVIWIKNKIQSVKCLHGTISKS